MEWSVRVNIDLCSIVLSVIRSVVCFPLPASNDCKQTETKQKLKGNPPGSPPNQGKWHFVYLTLRIARVVFDANRVMRISNLINSPKHWYCEPWDSINYEDGFLEEERRKKEKRINTKKGRKWRWVWLLVWSYVYVTPFIEQGRGRDL